ncbi:MFS transporter [Cupriavidus taiwanensis]|uniref:MFS transporter n=1 Tax=Cupriavidus taiwanensis TaxID=164546 RepID=UPI000E106A39|nr:MFS transporter [Cupriavidus taiwanensis]SPA55966.1 putative metabolite transport protein NicT [Cupriavidus taiwanensis]
MTAISVPKSDVLVESPEEKALFSKINWHILPLLLIAYCFAFIDRVNIGFAQLQMKGELHFSDQVFALGAGMFFVGYLLFEVPSNMLLERIGARKTILRIMLCWGACATGMAWVSEPWQFYTLRFLLGAFEAGFFPGVVLYFTYWYPPARRGRAIAVFMTSTVVSGILIGPVNGALMKFGHGFLGYQGWQWMFIVNGAPCLLIGFLCYLCLSDRPAEAKWLSSEQKKLLADRLARGGGSGGGSHKGALGALLRDPKVYVLSFICFLYLGAVYVLVFWVPTLIQSWGVQDVFHIGLLQGIPNIVGAAGMILMSRSSDRNNERRWHFVAGVVLIAAGLLGIAWLNGGVAESIALLSIATIGTASMTPLFFSFVSEYLPKEQAASGLALVSSLANIAPMVTPSISTWLRTSTGSNASSLLLVVALYAAAAVIMVFAARRPKLQYQVQGVSAL